jgi:hypothetical protein
MAEDKLGDRIVLAAILAAIRRVTDRLAAGEIGEDEAADLVEVEVAKVTSDPMIHWMHLIGNTHPNPLPVLRRVRNELRREIIRRGMPLNA